MAMPNKATWLKCALDGCEEQCERRPYQLKKTHGLAFCSRPHGAAYNRSKITVRPGRPVGIRIERPCSCGCGRIISKPPCDWRKSDKQNGGPIAYYEIQCHNRLLNVPGRAYTVDPSRVLKRETRACSLPGCGKPVSRMPSEFKSEMAFCDHVCANAFHNMRLSQQKTIEKACANPGCQKPERKFYVRRCENFRKYCSQVCMGADPDKIESCSRGGINGIIAQRGHPSSQEFILRDALAAAGIPHTPQVPYGAGIADFLVDGFLHVFVDGNYWHNYPNGTERDHRQEEFMTARGLAFIRFWEHEVDDAVAVCIERIKRVVAERAI